MEDRDRTLTADHDKRHQYSADPANPLAIRSIRNWSINASAPQAAGSVGFLRMQPSQDFDASLADRIVGSASS
ncbi:protein of unknown function [Bradyrhizobium vignae]|uniref:Uncharacterized protein n=1 Tax=Bradyrhizobium vignae TaxID=1549949 RepID=A0A2U3Q121_9BRAD|nr:protein of unknown function [Bradyrhizobium vignae]